MVDVLTVVVAAAAAFTLFIVHFVRKSFHSWLRIGSCIDGNKKVIY
jgi:hypothetical protein